MIWDFNPTLIGPYELPWHALFVVLELGVVAFLAWYYSKHGKLTMSELSWLLIIGAGHVYYTVDMAETNPTFDLEIRYYGVFFAIGLLGAARSMPLYFERWGFPRKHGEALTLWTPIGMLVGAHLIHLLFYETEVFFYVHPQTGEWIWFSQPIRIFQLGSGLASHGGGLGAILAVIFFARKNGIHPMKYMDPAMCAATWVIPWVRVGNFFNSEIVGREWDGPFAIWFPRHECPQYFHEATGVAQELCTQEIYRHPSQVYEAILAFLMLGLAIYLQRRWRNRLRPGAILFILLGYYFTTRFFIEYTKEYQALSDSFPLTMGQLLSLPIVLISLYMLLFSKMSNIRTTVGPDEATSDERLDEDEEPEPEAKAKATKRKKKRKKKKGA